MLLTTICTSPIETKRDRAEVVLLRNSVTWMKLKKINVTDVDACLMLLMLMPV